MRLKRTKQCSKCPWKVSTDPHDIPDGYSVEKHEKLFATIAQSPIQSAFVKKLHIMACHEHNSDEKVHCVGWLHNQLGVGNNIGLRMAMRECENLNKLIVHGEQHKHFDDTLPKEAQHE